MAAADGQESCANIGVIQASIQFLKNDARHREEKPYAFRYEPETKDIPYSNMETEKIEGISITDIRGRDDEFSLESNGFTVLRHQSALEYGEYFDPNRVRVYFQELEELLKVHFNVSRVEIFRHQVRSYRPKEGDTLSLIGSIGAKASSRLPFLYGQGV